MAKLSERRYSVRQSFDYGTKGNIAYEVIDATRESDEGEVRDVFHSHLLGNGNAERAAEERAALLNEEDAMPNIGK